MMQSENSNSKNEEKVQQQEAETTKPAPFKDAIAPNTQPDADEESALEQQRKEALTERD